MKQRILIVGAGFAGMWSALSAVRQLDRQGRDDVEVAVLAPQPELRIRPRFYEPDVQRMAAPLGELFAAVGVRFVQGSAQRIDVAGKRVEYRDAEGTPAQLDYDRLVLAAGSGVWRPASVVGIDAAFDVDQLEDALRLHTCMPCATCRIRRHATPWWSPAAASPASRPPPRCRRACGRSSARKRRCE